MACVSDAVSAASSAAERLPYKVAASDTPTICIASTSAFAGTGGSSNETNRKEMMAGESRGSSHFSWSAVVAGATGLTVRVVNAGATTKRAGALGTPPPAGTAPAIF